MHIVLRKPTFNMQSLALIFLVVLAAPVRSQVVYGSSGGSVSTPSLAGFFWSRAGNQIEGGSYTIRDVNVSDSYILWAGTSTNTNSPILKLATDGTLVFSGTIGRLSSFYNGSTDVNLGNQSQTESGCLGNGSTIGGGIHNVEGEFSATCSGLTTISGGWNNYAMDDYSFIGGGGDNRIISDPFDFFFSYAPTSIGPDVGGGYNAIPGGYFNVLNSIAGVIGGGRQNSSGQFGVFYTQQSVIGGGAYNIANGDWGVLAGGATNYNNASYSSIGGGRSNTTSGSYSIIPGGYANLAQGDYSFAAGQSSTASAKGSFVWNDSNTSLLGSVTDQFLIKAQGGFYVNSSSSSFGTGVVRSTFSNTGLALASNLVITLLGPNGNYTSVASVTASAFFGDGSHLTGIPSTSSIVGVYLPLSGGTLTGALTVTGTSVTANAFFGDGSHLTGIPSTSSIVGVYVQTAGDTMTGQLTNTSTITVTGNAFSVGASTFSILGGRISWSTLNTNGVMGWYNGASASTINVNGITMGKSQSIDDTNGTVTGGTINGVSQYNINGVLMNTVVPVYQACGFNAVTGLASGTTFFTFYNERSITGERITINILTASIGGGGDTVTCNLANGTNPLSVTSSNGAAAGTVTTATGSPNWKTSSQPINCHLETTAATKPEFNVCIGYKMQ